MVSTLLLESPPVVLFFDDIRTDPAGYLRKVCKHIGVRSDFEWDEHHLRVPVNKNPVHPLPDRFRVFLKEHHRHEIEELEKRFGDVVRRWQ